MFLENCWYCAGWDYEITQGQQSVVARELAGQPVVLYRTPQGQVVAMEDRCCHRQAPLRFGHKQGDSLRCGYHGILFGPDGVAREIPGQAVIPPKACVRTYPVVEKDNWVWVWMGDADKADPALICFAVGPGDPEWHMQTSQVSVNANYRLEIANLMDLSHVAWVHRSTLGGNSQWVDAKKTYTDIQNGVNTAFWMENSPPPTFTQHLFDSDAVFDMHASIDMTLPCNFVMRFQVWTPGTAAVGKDKGNLLLDSWSCQAVTPRNEDWVDYYYSWGLSRATDAPGMSELLLEGVNDGFVEDKEMLEGQHRNIKAHPDGNLINIRHDEGPNKLLWKLDKLIEQERQAKSCAA